MITDDVLPDWPPPPDETIGIERARAYIAWIRDHAGPLVAHGRQVITDRYPGVDIHTSAATVSQLADRGLDPRMTHLSIGCVWASASGGTWVMMDISIRRDGRLECTPGWNMK
jgi:hypothetical protein